VALAFALPSSYVSIITKFSKNVKSRLRNNRNIAHFTKGVCLTVRTIDKINYYLTKENKNGADLCEYLGVSSGVYSQWNTGRTHPRKSKLPIIAEYLGVEVSDIQGDDNNKKEKPTAQGGELISDLPENIQELISICLQNPDFTVLLLDLAQRMQNPPADPA
jgi:transcriptional regulator with XRE-family HTH domain